MGASASSVTFSLLPLGLPDSVLADTAQWERPVTPNVSGNGGDFYTLPDIEQIYSLTGYNSSWPIYDVTDPLQPKVLQTSVEKMQSGPATRHVIVAGPSFVRTPAVAANTPVDLASPRSADTVYIGPASLHSTLNPLAAYTKRTLVVEFPPKDDIHVSQWMTDRHAWYTVENFTAALRRHFPKISPVASLPAPRVLLVCER